VTLPTILIWCYVPLAYLLSGQPSWEDKSYGQRERHAAATQLRSTSFSRCH